MSTTVKTIRTTKALALVAVQALIAGTQKEFPNAQFRLGNVVYTSAQLVTLLQSVVAAMTKQTTAEQAAKDALTELRDLLTTANPVILEYRRQLVSMYGSASQILAEFGLEPRKVPTPLTTEEKAAAAAKRKATLAARKPATGQAAPAATTPKPAS